MICLGIIKIRKESGGIDMGKTMDEFNNKFKVVELRIYETDYWNWSLRPHQVTLGAGILLLKRECSTLAELSQDEFSDLNNIIKVIEPTLKNTLNYDIMNYLMLMMVDKQVHYHVIPRYANQIVLFNEIWKDNAWPGVPNLAGEALDINKLVNICSYIKNNIKL